MRPAGLSLFAAFILFCVALVRCVSAQSYPVTVIENPPSQPQSAFVLPVGDPEPNIGYRNWDIVIIHDPVAIPGLSNFKSYRIWTGRDDIDNINSVSIVSKNNSASGTTTVSVAPPPGNRFKNVGTVAMTEDSTGFVIVDKVSITGDFNGPLYAHRLNLAAGGDLAGDIILAPHASRLSTLEVRVDGNIRENVVLYVATSANGIPGAVDAIESTNGVIGTSTSPVYVLVGGGIKLLKAGEINAIVGGVGATGAESFALNIERIETYATGGFTGAFTGQLDVQNILNSTTQSNWINLAGPMRGVWRFGYGFVDNDSFQNFIQVPAGMFEGQVLWQTLGGNPANNPWVRPLYVGNQTTADDLNPKPHYLETSSEIGGGAAGRVPYGTHFTDCVPAQSGTDPYAIATVAYGTFDDKNPIKISHYGPVILPAAPQRAFKIERRPAGLAYSDATPWTDETGCFTEDLDDTGRRVLLIPTGLPLQRGFEYRVSQQLDASGNPHLLCDGVVIPTTPPPVDLFDSIPNTTTRREFRFAICGPSPGDADNSGCVNFADITKVNLNWFSTACGKDGDANRDGIVDFQDITSVLQNWGVAYCEGVCQASFSQGGGDGFTTLTTEGDVSAMEGPSAVLPALNSLGYPTIEAFGLAIDHMTDDDRAFEMARLQQMLDPSE